MFHNGPAGPFKGVFFETLPARCRKQAGKGAARSVRMGSGAPTARAGALQAVLAAEAGLCPHIWTEKGLFPIGESGCDTHISQGRKSLEESSLKAVNFFENQAKKGFDSFERRPYKPPPSTGRGAEALTTRWRRKKGLANLSVLWPSRRSIKERRPATTSKWKWRKGRPSGRIRPSFRGV